MWIFFESDSEKMIQICEKKMKGRRTIRGKKFKFSSAAREYPQISVLLLYGKKKVPPWNNSTLTLA